MPRSNAASSLDEASKTIIYKGANMSQLQVIFAISHQQLTQKIAGLQPSGERNGVMLFHIREVAERLAKPSPSEIESAIRRLNPADIPKMLSKEFWAGQRSKQDYLLKAGDLWPTAKVVSEVGELMKLVKMSAQLMSDAVERQTELSDRQRAIIKSLTDGMLDDLSKAVIKKFSKPEGVERGDVDDDSL